MLDTGRIVYGSWYSHTILIFLIHFPPTPLRQQYTTELKVRNEYMGFADFRAAFTSDSNPSFSVEPAEGSLSAKEDTEFIIRFRPQSPGTSEGSLVIETEDFKKTWKVIGST